jgi:hypothetical protein
MEVIYLYLAFSYLFMIGVTKTFGAPWYVDIILIVTAPIVTPIVMGLFHGSMSYYKGDE